MTVLVNVDVQNLRGDTLLNQLQFEQVRTFLANELVRASDPYAPFKQGVLKNSVRIENKGEFITYNTPYARYMWNGEVYVDPLYGVGGFYNEEYGWWSRPGVKKVPSGRELNYNGSPIRGKRWVERAFIDNQNAIENSVAQYITRVLGQ